jgi:hypothetical protein
MAAEVFFHKFSSVASWKVLSSSASEKSCSVQDIYRWDHIDKVTPHQTAQGGRINRVHIYNIQIMRKSQNQQVTICGLFLDFE